MRKIGSNVARDKASIRALHDAGWRVGVVWECALKGRRRRSAEDVLDAVSEWLTGTAGDLELAGLPEGQTAGLVR